MTTKRIKSKPILRWALRWHDLGSDGFMWASLQPLLFTTGLAARKYAHEKYGYILTRKDLRSPPHNWRLPRPVRVEVVLNEAGKVKR